MTPPGEATLLDDGLLSASEAAALDFTSELLVLSACNTASAGSLTGADSLSGLARSFIFAGARSVYASHWRVSDNITKELVLLAIDYALKYPGLTRSEALRKAMTSIRTGRREDGSLIEEWTPDWSHPSAWAPFVTITTLERKTSSEMS
jgi:CHAT domain-containing protein